MPSSADHGVGAGAPVDQVVAGVAEDRICKRIAEALEVGAALQDQRLNVRRQSVVDGGEDRVAALPGILVHHVAGIVDEVGVIAGTAAHGVGAGAAVDEVVAGIAEDRVGQRVAETLQVGAALQHQCLHIRRQPVVDGGEDRVAALPGILDHGIGGIVDEIGVIAGTAAHGVGAGTAVEQVVAGIAEQRVGQTVAEALEVGAALQHQSLHVGRQPVVDGGEDRGHRVRCHSGAGGGHGTQTLCTRIQA